MLEIENISTCNISVMPQGLAGSVRVRRVVKLQESAVSVVLPTPKQLRAVAEQCGLSLTDADVESFRGLMQGSIDAYNLVGAMPDELPPVKYPRTPGYRRLRRKIPATPGIANRPSRVPRAASSRARLSR
jgi:amidase